MPFLSLTRLRLRAWYHLPSFLLHATRSRKQAERSAGFLGGALSAEMPALTFWTATVWSDEAAMRAYQISGDHRTAMAKLGAVCDEASVAHVDRAGDQVPPPEAALRIMRELGRT